MKHFEELWEEAGGGICGKRACEKFYRKALEWVLTHRADIISTKFIEKELEE